MFQRLINCGFGATLAVALLLQQQPHGDVARVPDPVASGVEWHVRFSPRGGCTELIVDAIDNACTTIDVQAFSFTSEPISEALVRAHERGVAVQIVLDGGQRRARASRGAFCADAGIDVLYDEEHAIAHNKVVVIDGSTVITGSFNFTANAERSNAENCLLITDGRLANAYADNFARHREHAIR